MTSYFKSHVRVVLLSLLLLLYLLNLPQHHGALGFSTTTTSPNSRLDRAVEKATDKLTAFGNLEAATLIVDANNVRGIGKFAWDPLQLQQRVVACCTGFGIERTIIVWDHGSCPSAIPTSDDSVVLFSGLFHRADDVIVKEVEHLSSSLLLCSDGSDGSSGRREAGSLAIVTNDGGLASRIRQLQAKRASRISEFTDSSLGENTTIQVFDSTCFVELLSRVEEDVDEDTPQLFLDTGLALNATQESLRRFAAKQRQGWNPRREKTWQRCVLAETLRQSLCRHGGSSSSSPSSVGVAGAETATFASRYIQDLTSRGFAGVSDILQQQQQSSAGCSEIGGPNRLDKRQRRLLGRYNAFIRKERE